MLCLDTVLVVVVDVPEKARGFKAEKVSRTGLSINPVSGSFLFSSSSHGVDTLVVVEVVILLFVFCVVMIGSVCLAVLVVVVVVAIVVAFVFLVVVRVTLMASRPIIIDESFSAGVDVACMSSSSVSLSTTC